MDPGASSRKHQIKPAITYSKRRRKLAFDTAFDIDNDDMAFSPANIDYNAPPTVPPRPPKSQKEAMAANQPSAENVEMIVSMGFGDRAMAERYLRVSRS